MVIHRPNKDVLTEAIDIYRDCMRKFMILHLKRIPGHTPERAVEAALRDHQLNQFADHLKQGKALEAFIDVAHFQPLINRHWNPVFSKVWSGDRVIQDHCRSIATARDDVAHPGTQDIGTAQLIAYLYHISEALGIVNHPNEKNKVKELQDNLLGPEPDELMFEVGELWVQITEMRETAERRDNDIDRTMGELHPKVSEITRTQIESVEQLHAELARVNQNIVDLKMELDRQSRIISELRMSKAKETTGAYHAEFERLVSDVENTRRIMVELRSENASLRDSLDTLTGQLAEMDANKTAEIWRVGSEILNQLLSKLERLIATNTDDDEDWEEDEGEWERNEGETDEEEEDGDDEEYEDEENGLFLGRDLQRSFFNVVPDDRALQHDRSGAPPGVWPGARYYCTQQGCVFFDGSRRAWWHEWKAVTHMENTGHRIARV